VQPLAQEQDPTSVAKALLSNNTETNQVHGGRTNAHSSSLPYYHKEYPLPPYSEELINLYRNAAMGEDADWPFEKFVSSVTHGYGPSCLRLTLDLANGDQFEICTALGRQNWEESQQEEARGNDQSERERDTDLCRHRLCNCSHHWKRFDPSIEE